MWGKPTPFHGAKLIENNIQKRIEKSFLVDPLTKDNAIYCDLTTLS